MAYKDKDKQKAATRERVRRYRAKSVTPTNVTPDVTPFTKTKFQAKTGTDLNPLGLPDREMRHVRNSIARSQDNRKINTGQYKTIKELGPNEYNRVPLPGDADYEGVCDG